MNLFLRFFNGSNCENVGTINIFENINVDAFHGTGSYDGNISIAADIGCGIMMRWGAKYPSTGWIHTDITTSKIYINTTGVVNAFYIGGGYLRSDMNRYHYGSTITDFIMDNGTVNSEYIGASSTWRPYWDFSTYSFDTNFYIRGGRINTKRIGVGYSAMINNGEEGAMQYFKSFTMNGGVVNILTDPEISYPAGIGNCFCVGGQYSINNTDDEKYAHTMSTSRINDLKSTVITKVGGEILFQGNTTDESKMFLTGMSGKFEDNSDTKYLTIHTS